MKVGMLLSWRYSKNEDILKNVMLVYSQLFCPGTYITPLYLNKFLTLFQFAKLF